MPGEMVPIIVVPAIFFSFVAIVKVISDNSVRRKIVEKGELNEHVKHLFARQGEYVPSSLKWGLVLTAIGTAILIGQLAPVAYRDEVTISGMFIMAGLALIIYYFIARRLEKTAQEE